MTQEISYIRQYFSFAPPQPFLFPEITREEVCKKRPLREVQGRMKEENQVGRSTPKRTCIKINEGYRRLKSKKWNQVGKWLQKNRQSTFQYFHPQSPLESLLVGSVFFFFFLGRNLAGSVYKTRNQNVFLIFVTFGQLFVQWVEFQPFKKNKILVTFDFPYTTIRAMNLHLNKQNTIHACKCMNKQKIPTFLSSSTT